MKGTGWMPPQNENQQALIEYRLTKLEEAVDRIRKFGMAILVPLIVAVGKMLLDLLSQGAS